MANELELELLRQARNVYSGAVMDHWTTPRNRGRMDDPDGRARVKGPCGDTEIFVCVDNGVITRASFVTDGCSTAVSSGCIATQLTKGMTVKRAARIAQQDLVEALGGLPQESRHCAQLAANALHAAVTSCQCSVLATVSDVLGD